MSEIHVEVATQEQMEQALKDGRIPILVGDGTFILRSNQTVEAWGSSQPRVEAWGSSQPRVVARESSQPRVEARESSQPRVEARESSQPRVVAWESSQPSVVAWGSSQPRVEAWGSSQPRVEAWGSSQPRVVARESSQPRVEARESSQPRVEARESSQPRVVAWESSQPRVEARESSQPRVVARGYVQISVRGPVQVQAGPNVSVLVHGSGSSVVGGRQQRVALETAADWCDYYGVPISSEVVVLFKAVRDDFRSSHGTSYAPGTSPEAKDWDGGAAECGGGLHFSPHPAMALEFDDQATRFVACPVAIADIRPSKYTDEYPQKVKARRVCGPCFEVDRYGEPVVVRIETTNHVT